MRVLALEPGPNFSVADVHRGWVKGFSANGCRVANFNFADRLTFYEQAHVDPDGTGLRQAFTVEEAVALAANGIKAACFEYAPDVLFVTSGFYVPLDVLDIVRARGIKVVLLHTESPYEDDRQVNRALHADVNLINDPTNLGRFTEACPDSWYVPHAYDPDVHHPRQPTPPMASDFCFVGTGYPGRMAFFSQVRWDGIDVALGGNWQHATGTPLERFVVHPLDACLPNEEAADLYASTKASANVYRTEAERPDLLDGWAMGPREVELAAIGCFYLTESRGENREVLGFVPTFVGPGDFSEKLRWWLAHPTAREVVASKAREAIADRTFVNHAAQVLRRIAA